MSDDRGPPVILTAIAAAGLLASSLSTPREATAALPQPSNTVPGGSNAAAKPGEREGPVAKAGFEGYGPWAITKRVVAGFTEDRIMTEAAGVTFYALLALFPAITTLVSLYGLFADPVAVGEQLQAAAGVIPGGGLDLIEAQVKSLAANGRTALGWGVLLGFLTSLWSANQGIKSLFDALNVVFHARETRGYLRRTVVSLGMTLGGILFIAVAMAAVVAVPIVLNFVGFGSWTGTLLKIARWPLLMIMLGLFLAMVYTYGPDRKRPRWKWVTWGSGFSAVMWVLGSVAFSYYVQNFGSYNKTYGALGAVIGFITWIWISMMIVLLGAELNSDLEQLHEPRPS